MATTLDRCLIQCTTEAVSCELAGESVILDMASGRYFALDPVGTRIWSLLQAAPCTSDSICERLMAEYDVSAEDCRRDVAALLSRMAESGLVQFQDVS